MPASFPKAYYVPGTTTGARALSYLPVDVTTITNDSTSGERFSMFYPLGKPQDYGWTTGRWPVLAWTELLGFTSSASTYADSTNQSFADTLFQWQCLSRGIAVASAQVTAAEATKAYSGRGFFNPPGHSGGYYENTTYPNARKDAMYFIQHLRKKSGDYLLDPGAVCLAGGSAGSDISAWCAFGPERKWELGQGGQYNESTIPNAYISRGMCLAWWEAMDQTEATFSKGFPTDAGGNAVALTPQQIGANAAESLQYQRAASIMGYSGHRCGNPPPVLLHAFEDNVSFKFYQPYPASTELVGNTHTIWQFCALKSQWPSSVTLMATSGVTNRTTLQNAGYVDEATGNFDTNYTLETNPNVPLGQWARGDVIDWLVKNIRTPNVWYEENRGPKRWHTMVNTTGRFVVAPNPARKEGVRITCTDQTNGALWGEYAASTEKGYIAPRGAVNSERSVVVRGDGPVWVASEANTATLIVEEI